MCVCRDRLSQFISFLSLWLLFGVVNAGREVYAVAQEHIARRNAKGGRQGKGLALPPMSLAEKRREGRTDGRRGRGERMRCGRNAH